MTTPLPVSSVVSTFMQATTKAGMQLAAGTAQLPAWLFGAPAAGAGTFTADTAQPSDTTVLTFNVSPLNGVSILNLFGALAIGSILILTDQTGKASVFYMQSAINTDPYFGFSVIPYSAVATAWAGTYALSICPTAQTYSQVGAASAAQGTLADTALQPNAVSGTFTTITVVNGLVTGGS